MADIAAVVTRSEPQLVKIIRRLADLEAAAFISPSQGHELNALRMELAIRWPEVGAALAHAYLTDVT